MKSLKRILAGLISGFAVIGTVNVQAQSNINQMPILVPNVVTDCVNDVSDVIRQITENLEMEQVETETTYTYVREPVYSEVYYDITAYENLYNEETVDAFESELVFAEAGNEQIAYEEALSRYRLALAEYEAASQMIEAVKEVEVEIIEEVTDEDGNVTEQTRTETQTVVEMVPAGDITSAQNKLDNAVAELVNAQRALEDAKNTVSTDANITEEVEFINEETLVDEEITLADSGSCGENLTYTIDDNGLVIISGTGELSDYAFYGAGNIKEVIIPQGVTKIGYATFYNCGSLAAITIPDSVTGSGKYSFTWDKNLKDVYYLGSKVSFQSKDLYHFESGTQIHYLGKPFPFEDVSEDAWYYTASKECYEIGLLSGTSSTTFSPMQDLTRAMVVTILWRMEGNPSVSFNNKFKDVSANQWYANSISWAVDTGVVHGYGDGTFKPDAPVTREQVAVMLANYVQYRNCYVKGTKKLNEYPDGSQVSSWAQNGMKWAISNGIISGNGEGYLRPLKSATRAEGATMLLRVYNWLDMNDPVIYARKKGIVGFVEWLVEKGYATGNQDATVVANLSDNLEKYNLDASSFNSPFNLDNVVKSINSIKQCNDLRELPIHGLNALKITNYMMLVAAIQNCASWDLYEEGHWYHSQIYNVGENIALNYDDPFDGWYYEEKEAYDAGRSEEAGHYLNIIEDSYEITGFAWGFMKHSSQVFLWDTGSAATYTPEEYLDLLNQYRTEFGV